jgi:hypothetical protein
MADGVVQVQPDSTGKYIDTTEFVRPDLKTVERERVDIPDSVAITNDTLLAILVELQVISLLLAQGFAFKDELEALRETVRSANRR